MFERRCVNCGAEILSRNPRSDDALLLVCDDEPCQTRLLVAKNHGYPLHFCQHGNTRAYCAQCITAGLYQRPVYQGTGIEWKDFPEPYKYIVAPLEQEENEDVLEIPHSVEPVPIVPARDRVEVLIPPPHPVPEELPVEMCPHGGIIYDGLIYCGHCQTTNDSEVGFHLFYTDLWDICRREGRRNYYHRVDSRDAAQHAFQVVWSKMGKILKANNPRALACRIAQQATKDLFKKAYNWREVPVSDGSGDVSNKSGGSTSPTASYNGDDLGDNSWLETADFNKQYRGEQPGEHGRGKAYLGPSQVGQGDWSIPGGERCWIPPCYRRLEFALEEAMAALPRPPQDRVPMATSMMIKRWVGYFPEMGEQSYEEIGQLCFPVTNARRVKHLIQKGLAQAREHILRLTGDRARQEMQ